MIIVGEVYVFTFGKNVCSAFVRFAFFGHKSAKSICAVAIGVIHFSVCVASVAHTFYFGSILNVGVKPDR